jgi:hypothetical protein
MPRQASSGAPTDTRSVPFRTERNPAVLASNAVHLARLLKKERYPGRDAGIRYAARLSRAGRACLGGTFKPTAGAGGPVDKSTRSANGVFQRLALCITPDVDPDYGWQTGKKQPRSMAFAPQ